MLIFSSSSVLLGTMLGMDYFSYTVVCFHEGASCPIGSKVCCQSLSQEDVEPDSNIAQQGSWGRMQSEVLRALPGRTYIRYLRFRNDGIS